MIFAGGRAGKGAPMGGRPPIPAGAHFPPQPQAQQKPAAKAAKGALALAATGGQSPLEAMEQQLSAQANGVYESILNLNVSMAKLSQDWDRLMSLRTKILIMYGVPAHEAALPKPAAAGAPMGKGNAGVTQPMQALLAYMGMGGMSGMGGGADWWGGDAGVGAGAAAGGAQESDYKSKLNQAVTKRAKRSMTKTDLVYTVQEAEGGGYIASLAGPEVLTQPEYWSPAPAPSKRAAEHEAAKAALQAEFPEVLAADGWGDIWGAMAPPSKKRKLDPAIAAAAPGVVNEDPKSQLCRAAQLLLGRTCGKNDIVYEVVDLESPPEARYQATVVLPEYNAQAIHKGEPAESIKQAQMNAAQVAVNAWSHIIAPLEEERKAKKAAANREKLDALKTRKLAGKAAAAGLTAAM